MRSGHKTRLVRQRAHDLPSIRNKFVASIANSVLVHFSRQEAHLVISSMSLELIVLLSLLCRTGQDETLVQLACSVQRP